MRTHQIKVKKPKPIGISKESLLEKGTKAYDLAYAALAEMRHKDLQKNCVVRGMEPKEVVESSDPQLASWFLSNFMVTPNQELLGVFDNFVEHELRNRGYKDNDLLLDPSLRLGFIPDDDELEVINKKNNTIKKLEEKTNDTKPPKEKRVFDKAIGVFSGTKKALTFKLADEGKDINETINGVMSIFPEAQEKSIRIWYRKRIKATQK